MRRRDEIACRYSLGIILLGGDLDIIGHSGYAPFQIAALFKTNAVIKRLMRFEAHVDAVGAGENNAFDWYMRNSEKFTSQASPNFKEARASITSVSVTQRKHCRTIRYIACAASDLPMRTSSAKGKALACRPAAGYDASVADTR